MLLQIGSVQRETSPLLANKLRDGRSVDAVTVEKGQQPGQWNLAKEAFDVSAIPWRYPSGTDHVGQSFAIYPICERHVDAGHQQLCNPCGF
jgi:hypothetical protein